MSRRSRCTTRPASGSARDRRGRRARSGPTASLGEVLGGGITNHNLKVTRRRGVRAPDRRQGHRAARDRPLGRARGHARAAALGIGPDVVDFVEPEGWLVTRFVDGRDRAGDDARRRRPRSAPSRRRRRSPAGSTRSGSSRPTPTPRSPRGVAAAARVRGAQASPTGSRSGRGARPRRATTTCSTRTSSTRRAAPDRRLGVRGHGRPVLRPGELLGQQRARPDGRAALAAYGGGDPRDPRPDALHVRLPRGDVGRRAARVSELDFDFAGYAAEHFDGSSGRPPSPDSPRLWSHGETRMARAARPCDGGIVGLRSGSREEPRPAADGQVRADRRAEAPGPGL